MFYNTQGNYIFKNNIVESFVETTSKINESNSCNNLIKQSYADFDKKYQLLKTEYDVKLKDQKNMTDNTMKQFLDEKEEWNKKFEERKNQCDKSINEEKKKLTDLKKMFEERINLLDTSIKEISLAIKKI